MTQVVLPRPRLQPGTSNPPVHTSNRKVAIAVLMALLLIGVISLMAHRPSGTKPPTARPSVAAGCVALNVTAMTAAGHHFSDSALADSPKSCISQSVVSAITLAGTSGFALGIRSFESAGSFELNSINGQAAGGQSDQVRSFVDLMAANGGTSSILTDGNGTYLQVSF